MPRVGNSMFSWQWAHWHVTKNSLRSIWIGALSRLDSTGFMMSLPQCMHLEAPSGTGPLHASHFLRLSGPARIIAQPITPKTAPVSQASDLPLLLPKACPTTPPTKTQMRIMKRPSTNLSEPSFVQGKSFPTDRRNLITPTQ